MRRNFIFPLAWVKIWAKVKAVLLQNRLSFTLRPWLEISGILNM
jgi:hypothetical protein